MLHAPGIRISGNGLTVFCDSSNEPEGPKALGGTVLALCIYYV